jgi:LmbE family N-acetylglucosaminyl deacetylase
MLALELSGVKAPVHSVLCLGAHCDDLEIGCGGTLLKLTEARDDLMVNWIVFSSTGEREREARRSAAAFLRRAKEKQILVEHFRDGFFPYSGAEIKEYFERLKEEFVPDLIFTHYRGDAHQDHRQICELTWNTFRDHWILEYEIPKYDGDLGNPNLFVHLDAFTCRRKVGHLLSHFKTQGEKHWFSEDTFLSIMRLRGVESKAPEKYAEAFYCRKMALW